MALGQRHLHLLRPFRPQANEVHSAAVRTYLSGLILVAGCAVAISGAYQRDSESIAWREVVAARAALRVYQLDQAMPWAERQRLIAEAVAFYERAYRFQLADARQSPADAAQAALASPWSPSR